MASNKTLVFLLTLVLSGYNFGQNTTKIKIGGDVGYFFPIGDWASHQYASGISQFQGGYSLTPEIAIKFSDISLGIFYNYTKLRTSEWEDFVRSEGNTINVSASLSQLGGFIRYYFLSRERHLFNFEVGMNYIFLKGDEQFNGYSYEYDFLNPGIGFLIGLGFEYELNNRLSAVVNSRVFWKPEGIMYNDGKAYDIFGVYIMPGIRLNI